MSLEIGVLQLEKTMEVADRVHPSKIDPSVCVFVFVGVCASVDISNPRLYIH